MRVVLAGGSGLVGTALAQRLLAGGHGVTVLSRDPARARRALPLMRAPRLEVVGYTPLRPGPWQRAVGACDAVINLAGEPIVGGRWTTGRRHAILESRVLTTRMLAQAIAGAEPRPSVMLSASAVGYYGSSETAAFDERSAAGSDFLAQVCQAWEAEAQAVAEAGTRVAILRLGIVLASEGPLVPLLAPFRYFAGGVVGNGRQWVSWVHRDDLVSLMLAALRDPALSGPLNATAPHPVTMAELSAVLGRLLQRPSWLRVPTCVLRGALGDAAAVILEGQRVIPRRVLAHGFRYQYPTVDVALAQILGTGPR